MKKYFFTFILVIGVLFLQPHIVLAQEVCSDGFCCQKMPDGKCDPGTGRLEVPSDNRDDAACKQTCQSSYNTCANQCPVINSGQTKYDPKKSYDCVIKCNTAGNMAWWHCVDSNGACRGQVNDINDQCSEVCQGQVNDADNQCMADCDPEETTKQIPDKNCEDVCKQNKSTCESDCQNKDAANQPPGASSLNLRELAQANAEFQQAQADLDNIKKSSKQRWQASQDFAAEYASALNEVSNDNVDGLMALRLNVEKVHEAASKVKDWSEFSETLKKIKESELGSYSNLDISTDAVKLFNEYNDLTDQGVAPKDALTKATLDNFGASALKMIPVLNAIDLIATTPDALLNTLGVGEKNWVRHYITQGIISKFAPSEVIKQTTQIMVENSWSGMGNTLAYAWGKVKNADGVEDTLIKFGLFEDVVIASVPVGIARGVSSLVGAGGEAVNYVANWFTY